MTCTRDRRIWSAALVAATLFTAMPAAWAQSPSARTRPAPTEAISSSELDILGCLYGGSIGGASTFYFQSGLTTVTSSLLGPLLMVPAVTAGMVAGCVVGYVIGPTLGLLYH